MEESCHLNRISVIRCAGLQTFAATNRQLMSAELKIQD